jgi:hypothetical protein
MKGHDISYRAPNNGMHPPARSAPLIKLASCDVGYVIAAGGG